MKMKLFVLTFGIFLSCAMNVFAQSAGLNVGNKVCPVSGDAIGSMGEGGTVEHNGKMYHLCCDMCSKDFKAAPEKYSKIAEDEASAAAAGHEAPAEESHEGHAH